MLTMSRWTSLSHRQAFLLKETPSPTHSSVPQQQRSSLIDPKRPSQLPACLPSPLPIFLPSPSTCCLQLYPAACQQHEEHTGDTPAHVELSRCWGHVRASRQHPCVPPTLSRAHGSLKVGTRRVTLSSELWRLRVGTFKARCGIPGPVPSLTPVIETPYCYGTRLSKGILGATGDMTCVQISVGVSG